MGSDIEELADALAQAAHDVRWAQDWRDVGDLLARFEQRARDAHEEAAAVVAERDRLRTERDRLRRELEALRDEMVTEWRRGDVDASPAALRSRFDDILSGGEQ